MADSFVNILQAAVEKKASDIHLVIGYPPMVRILGRVQPLQGFQPITVQDSTKLIYSILFENQRRQFEETKELDCSVAVPNLARFRVNVFLARKGVEAVLRVINNNIPDTKSIGFTPVMDELVKMPRGLILVTGPTGSGKSTTLASLVDSINQSREEHILTIEDPIEYIFEPRKCIVRQREIGVTTNSYANALKSALREDPDVILLGEMRDLETISLALTASETGHLVLSTLHTTDAPQTIDRIIDVFPPHQQQQVKIQLSTTLRAVICQTLIPTVDGQGRVAAREVMIVTPAIANLIREGKTHMIYSAIETGAKFGMISLDQCLEGLVKTKKITMEEALMKARDPQKVQGVVREAQQDDWDRNIKIVKNF